MARNIRSLLANLNSPVLTRVPITTTQIWTAPPGVFWALLRGVASGAGGGGGGWYTTGSPAGGGGGGSGAWIWDLFVQLVTGNQIDITIGAPGLGGLGSTQVNSSSSQQDGGDATDTIIVCPDFAITLGGGFGGARGSSSSGASGQDGEISFAGALTADNIMFGNGARGESGLDDAGPQIGRAHLFQPAAPPDPGSAAITDGGGSAGGGGSSPYAVGGYGGGQETSGGQSRPGQDAQGPGAGGGGGGPSGVSGGTNGGDAGDGGPSLVEIYYGM